MLLRHSLGLHTEADVVERAVDEVIADGARTADMITAPTEKALSTSELGALVRNAISETPAVSRASYAV